MSPGSATPTNLTPGLAFDRELSTPRPARSFRIVRVAAIWEAFFVAFGSLRQNKLRPALTLVGIIVGVTAVIAVVTIIKGLDQTVAQTFSSQGSTVFTISKRPRVITSREDFIKFNKRKDITEDDAQAIFRLCSACWRAGIAANDVVPVKHGNQKADAVAVEHDIDAERGEPVRRADAGAMQQLDRSDRAGAQDDFALRTGLENLATADKSHANGAPVLDDETVDQHLLFQAQIRAAERGF